MTLDKQRFEMPLEYIERVLEAVTQNLKLRGVTLACTSDKGKHFIISQGDPPPIQLFEKED